MKKFTLILKMIIVLAAFSNVSAQIINGDFETIKPVSGLASNWGKNYSINLTIDTSTGITTSDEIQYSGCSSYLCYPTPDSHSGQYALEMTNFYNITQNRVIVGGAFLFEDATQDFPPGGNYNLNMSRVPYNSNALYGNQAASLGFYYKFLPLGNDVAEANLELFNIDGNSVGKVSVPISGTNTDYNYIYSTVNFTSNETPVSMSLSFTMAKEGSTPTFGSSLVIDDVTINNAALQINRSVNDQFIVYPTLANEEINIRKGNSIIDSNYSFQIYNIEGKIVSQNTLSFKNSETVKIDISQLSKGLYFLTTKVNDKENTTKFIKK